MRAAPSGCVGATCPPAGLEPLEHRAALVPLVPAEREVGEAAEEFFGDTTSAEARAAIAYVNDAG
jgi:hypothetical protein